MSQNRQRWLRRAILFLPFAFLTLWIASLPLPLPYVLVPHRSYLAFGRQAADNNRGALFSEAGRRDTFLVLPDQLVALPRDRKAFTDTVGAHMSLLPDSPVFGPVIADMAETPGRACGFRIISSRKPSAEELEAIREAAGVRRVELKIIGEDDSSPVQAATRKLDSFSGTIGAELLLSPEAAHAEHLSVLFSGTDKYVFSAPGADLPPDRVLSITMDRKRAVGIIVSAVMPGGRILKQELSFESEIERKPELLLVSDNTSPTVLDSLYTVKRLSPASAGGVDLSAFELIVLDGIPLSAIRGKMESGLLAAIRNRSGSLLFVADSPDFGIEGANPSLEEILPVTLLPRSLKNLPDMAILVLLDISGSMFGDKLSLAKVTGLELFRNLKPEDLVGLMLFSDSHEWIYRFERNSGLKPALPLEPITARGGTELGPVLREGIEALSRESYPEKHIVIISDGVSKPDDFVAIAADAASRGITISAMGIGKDANRNLLSSIASRAKGRYYSVESADSIPALMFEDRTSVARPPFARGRIPIIALDGSKSGEVSGMTQYTARPGALVVFANESGDPFFASREYGNRASLFFASDIHGSMTKDFFSVPRALSGFKSRLDSLFTTSPLELSVAEMYGLTEVIIRGDRMIQPRIVFSKNGSPEIEAKFRRSPSGLWAAAAALPESGEWHARIVDRGTVVSGFSMMANHGFSGQRTVDAKALRSFRTPFFALLPRPELWLLFFFAASLASSLVLRKFAANPVGRRRP